MGTLLLSQKERQRLEILSRVGEGVIAKACGDLIVRYGGEALQWVEVLKRPERVKQKKAKKPVKNNKHYVPGPQHPFNRIPACPGSRSGVRAPST